MTWKQVWVNRSTCSVTAATTRGAEEPTVVTAMPAARSMNRLPSTSSTMPPEARAANTGSVVPTPVGSAACRRAISSWELGPGIGGGEVAVLGQRVGHSGSVSPSAPRRRVRPRAIGAESATMTV